MSNTLKVGSYWDNEGKYQAEYSKAWEQLIPAQGEADDGWPEALRAISRIGYDYYNNGFCNLWQGWEDVDDDGEDCMVYEMDSFYEDLVDYLACHVPYNMHKELRGFLLDAQGYGNWSDRDVIIHQITDHIMEGIIEDELLETETA